MADVGLQDQENTGSSVDSGKLAEKENGENKASSAASGSPSHKEASQKKEKERDREERIRAVKERQKAERQRKIDELLEAQKLAQEHRARQQELRKRKIEELRRREDERRAAVEERRRRRDEMEKAKHEAILAKTTERLARYEAWKASGKGKGLVPGHVPPSKRLSASTSVLYHKKTPDLGSSPGHLNASMRNIPSAHALGTIPENRSFLATHGGSTPHRPRSTVGLHSPKTGDSPNSQQRPSRKPRPASIAGNLPAFVTLSPPSSTSRSKSSERVHKEKRPRPKSLGPERKTKISDEKSDSQKSQTPPARPTLRRTTISAIERLAVPKHTREKTDTPKSAEKLPQKGKTAGVENLDDSASTGTVESTPSKDSLSVSKPKRNHTPKPPRELPATPVTNSGGGQGAGHTEVEHDNINKPPSMEEEYKAKLAENRRQAREKAEREAEEERLKIEEERLKEEQRRREEEEAERLAEEEAHRLAEEARRAEEERLQAAIEAEEARKREEAEKMEQERLAKEEADRKAKEEAEKTERERQEKAKRDEEERLERKKRLESIMKRVKTDPQLESSKSSELQARSNQGSPVKSSSSVELSNEDKTDDEEGAISPEETTVEEQSTPSKGEDRMQVSEEEGRPKFSSPLLKQLMDKRAEDSPGDDRPKFKSPLLQNLLGKSKMVRSSSDKSLSDNKSDNEDSDTGRHSPAQRKLISVQDYNDYNGKDDSEVPTNGMGGEEKGSEGTDDQPSGGETSPSSPSGETTLVSIVPVDEQINAQCNGLESHLTVDDNSQGLVDSSISMRTDDTGRSLTSSYRDDDLVTSIEPPGGELVSQGNEEGFEDIINLSVSNKNLSYEETTSSLRTTTADDLLNFNSLDQQGDDTPKAPFIAFEDNAVKRQDVTSDLLS